MNKFLHVLVYVFLVLAGAGLWFELQLNDKRALLTDRNRLQEDYFVKIARTVEKAGPEKQTPPELKLDRSPVEARLVDSPDMENVLEEYNAQYEQTNLDTFDWENSRARDQLRMIYVLDGEGNPVMDGNQPLKKGPGTEDEILNRLFEAAKDQQSRLNSTRAELKSLRGKLEGVVDELNKLKPVARQDKVTIVEKDGKITKLEADKTQLEGQITKLKSDIDELNAEVTSAKDEATAAKDEADAAREDLAKSVKLVEQLKKLLAESYQTQGSASASGGEAVKSIPAGEKGVVVEANNEYMFAIVKFSAEAIEEMRGKNKDRPLPQLELGLRRKGYKGPAGEFVGRLRLRQEVKGKPYVICDILGAWEQAKAEKDDIVFAD